MNTIVLPENFSWQGHRGARGLVPENSIPSFLKALEYPVTTLELDLAVSKDKQLIVSHEPYFNHNICLMPDGKAIDEATGQKMNIYQMTYEEIKQYDCGSKGNERFPEQVAQKTFKPSLKDMVRAVEMYCKNNNRTLPSYNIELKSAPEYYGIYFPHPKEFVELVLTELKALGIEKKSNLQSFDIEVLKEINRQDATLPVAFLVENEASIEENLAKIDFMPTIYSPYFKLLNKEKVARLHEKGIQVIPWTVNTLVDARNLIEMGVDGIITDYPNMAKSK